MKRSAEHEKVGRMFSVYKFMMLFEKIFLFHNHLLDMKHTSVFLKTEKNKDNSYYYRINWTLDKNPAHNICIIYQ